MTRRKYKEYRNGEPRKLNKYTASPDGKCEWCMEPSLFIECEVCVLGVAVDDKVRLPDPNRKAQCGHPSSNYFHCPTCIVEHIRPELHTTDLYSFCRQVQSFDLRKLGASHANGTVEASLSKANTKRPDEIEEHIFLPADDALHLTSPKGNAND